MATPIPAAEAMWTLLQILTDPKAAAKRLKTLQAETATLEARIREVGVVGEIEALLARSRADRTMAAESLALAQKEAATLTAAARTERDAAHAEAEAGRQALAAERMALDHAIGEAATEAANRHSALAARELDVSQAEAKVARLMRENEHLRASLATRLETLRVATQEVAG